MYTESPLKKLSITRLRHISPLDPSRDANHRPLRVKWSSARGHLKISNMQSWHRGQLREAAKATQRPALSRLFTVLGEAGSAPFALASEAAETIALTESSPRSLHPLPICHQVLVASLEAHPRGWALLASQEAETRALASEAAGQPVAAELKLGISRALAEAARSSDATWGQILYLIAKDTVHEELSLLNFGGETSSGVEGLLGFFGLGLNDTWYFEDGSAVEYSSGTWKAFAHRSIEIEP